MSSKWLKNVKKANNEKCPLGVRGRRESPTPKKCIPPPGEWVWVLCIL